MVRHVGTFAGLSYGLVVCLSLRHGLRRSGATGLGPANWVTLGRAVLVGGVTVLVAQSFVADVPVAAIVAVASVALALDWVDGHVARRTHTESAVGARFDMEIDSFLLLVLSTYVARTLGTWVLSIGLMRYAYVVAGWALRWLRRPVPPRYWRKVVAATQGVVLTCAASGLFPDWLSIAAVAVALGLLIGSFGSEMLEQARHRSGA